MLQCGLGNSWTVGGQPESGPRVDMIGHLWSAEGRRDSAQVGAQCALSSWT